MDIIKNKVVFISGASSGIGRATSEAFASYGARIVLGCRNKGDCEEIIKECAAMGGLAKEVYGDLSNLEGLSDIASGIINAWGDLDILVNNAAIISPMARIEKIDLHELDKCMRINVTAQIGLISKVWGSLAKNKGTVINILSGAAKNPRLGWAAYCASKAALHMVTKQVFLEGEELGIKSFGFSPGLVNTKMQKEIRHSGINEIAFLPESDMIDPVEPAKCIFLLASGKYDNYNGQFLDIRDDLFKNR